MPGITAMQDLASRSGTVLLEGDERLALLPFTAGEDALREALAGFETVVCYKGGSRLGEVLRVAEEAGRLESAVYGAQARDRGRGGRRRRGRWSGGRGRICRRWSSPEGAPELG